MERKVATIAMPRAQKEVEAVERTPRKLRWQQDLSNPSSGDNPRLAKIDSRGTPLGDTGASSSVSRPEAFQTAALNTEAVEELHTVDDTPLKACGEIRPKLRLGNQHKEETHVTFQVVESITDNILSVI
jgi:hypothetical protein